MATCFILTTSEYCGKIIDSGVMRIPGMEYLYNEIYEPGAEFGFKMILCP